MAPLLSKEQLESFLRDNPEWRLQDGALARRFRFGTYMEGLQFAEAVAVEAESRDHHPDILLAYKEVTLFLTSNDVGGVTERDLESARAADGIASSRGAR